MNQRLILHIGQPKTGTTTLQKTLQASRPALLNAGILHPDTGRHHNHKILVPYLTGNKSTFPHCASIERSRERWDNMLNEVDIVKPSIGILSSEQLFRLSAAETASKTISKLRSITPEIIISAYVREPASSALSNAQQNLKRKAHFTQRSCSFYRDTLEPYSNAGADMLTVKVFGHNTLTGGDIVEDFITEFIPVIDHKKLHRCKNANISMSAEAMALMQEIHRGERLAPFSKVVKIMAQKDLMLEGYSRPQMHDHVRQAIQSRCTDLQWLEDNFGIKFACVDAAAMPRKEANKLYDSLDRVVDICNVNNERKEYLWRTVCKHHSPMRRFIRNILKFKPAS